MYDKFLSPQWIFDRCLEGQTLFVPLSLILPSVVVLYFLVKTRKKVLEKILGSIFLFMAVLILIILFTIASYLLLDCAPSKLFKAVDAAHRIQEVMKEKHSEDGRWPISEVELSTIDPQYGVLVKNAKIKYIFEPQTDSYTLFVRPSLYSVYIFDDKNGFGFYSLSGIFKYRKWDYQPYPPPYEGPWDQLPN